MKLLPLPWALVLWSLTTVTSLAGQSDPAVTWNRADVSQYASTEPTLTVGWEFEVTGALEVSAIGVFDVELPFAPSGGLATPKAVGLWDVGASPIAFANVPSGQGATLCQDGYRYAELDEPVALQVGRRYVVAAFWPSDSGADDFDDYPDLEASGTPTWFDPRVDFVRSRKRVAPVFGFPDVPVPGEDFVGAVNFRIGAGGCAPNPPAGFTTTFAGGNNQAGNMFDVIALEPGGLRVDGWQINLDDAATNDTPVVVRIWWRKDSHVGHTDSPDGWSLLGEAAVLSWGPNQPTPVPIGGLDLPEGAKIGVYISTEFVSGVPSPPPLRYTNVGVVPQTIANDDVAVIAGVGKGAPFFSGATIPGRMWNGGIVYREAGTWLDLGCGLPGAFGEPLLAASGSLETGEPVTFTLSNALPFSTALLVFGTTKINVPLLGGTLVPGPAAFGELPLDVTGSRVLTTLWPGGVPSGELVFLQAWTPDPTAPFGWAASNAVQGTVP